MTVANKQSVSLANFFDPRLPSRFWAKCIPEPNSTCWLWLGGTIRGYGSISMGPKTKYVHRVSYVALVGQIADGHQIDHLCRNTLCVNPAHLESVTPRENNLRSTSISARRARQTHCIYGHSLADAYLIKGRYRRCRECQRIKDAGRTKRGERRRRGS